MEYKEIHFKYQVMADKLKSDVVILILIQHDRY